MSRTVTTLPSQTIMDIAIQECGSLAAWPDIAAMNGLNLTDEVPAGTALLIPDPVIDRVAAIYERNGYKPATTPTDILEGIDYWFVYEYIVQ